MCAGCSMEGRTTPGKPNHPAGGGAGGHMGYTADTPVSKLIRTKASKAAVTVTHLGHVQPGPRV
jgi:hypothetical protein